LYRLFYKDASEQELQQALEPYIRNWALIKQKAVFNKLHVAQDDAKLAIGIHDVWKYANRKHGQLLVVEKDFYCPAFVTEDGEITFCTDTNDKTTIETNDIVNDIIEKVLGSGGDVEFVNELKDFNHIALIEYFRDN